MDATEELLANSGDGRTSFQCGAFAFGFFINSRSWSDFLSPRHARLLSGVQRSLRTLGQHRLPPRSRQQSDRRLRGRDHKNPAVVESADLACAPRPNPMFVFSRICSTPRSRLMPRTAEIAPLSTLMVPVWLQTGEAELCRKVGGSN